MVACGGQFVSGRTPWPALSLPEAAAFGVVLTDRVDDVILGRDDASFMAWRASDGGRSWSARSDGLPLDALVASPELVVTWELVAGETRVCGLSAHSGSRRWCRPAPDLQTIPPLGLVYRGRAVLASGSYDQPTVAIDDSGAVAWTAPPGITNWSWTAGDATAGALRESEVTWYSLANGEVLSVEPRARHEAIWPVGECRTSVSASGALVRCRAAATALEVPFVFVGLEATESLLVGVGRLPNDGAGWQLLGLDRESATLAAVGPRVGVPGGPEIRVLEGRMCWHSLVHPGECVCDDPGLGAAVHWRWVEGGLIRTLPDRADPARPGDSRIIPTRACPSWSSYLDRVAPP